MPEHGVAQNCCARVWELAAPRFAAPWPPTAEIPNTGLPETEGVSEAQPLQGLPQHCPLQEWLN
ncbi:MAG: hypothetical protein WA824_10635, partial [Candidatus Sulfotelmatobacter sp.]